jgi:hypothetical protein
MDRTIEIEMLPPTPLKEAPSALEAPKSPSGGARRMSRLIKNDYKPVRGTQNNHRQQTWNQINHVRSRTQRAIEKKQCPYCNRVFNLHIADNHIPICKKTEARPKPPLSKNEAMKLQTTRKQKYQRAQSVNAS